MNNDFKIFFESLPYDECNKEHISIKGLLMNFSENIIRFLIFPVVIEVNKNDIITIEEQELPDDHARYNLPIVSLILKRGACIQDMYVCPLPELVCGKTSIFSLHARSEFKDFIPLYRNYLQLEDEYRAKFGLCSCPEIISSSARANRVV